MSSSAGPQPIHALAPTTNLESTVYRLHLCTSHKEIGKNSLFVQNPFHLIRTKSCAFSACSSVLIREEIAFGTRFHLSDDILGKRSTVILYIVEYDFFISQIIAFAIGRIAIKVGNLPVRQCFSEGRCNWQRSTNLSWVIASNPAPTKQQLPNCKCNDLWNEATIHNKVENESVSFPEYC